MWRVRLKIEFMSAKYTIVGLGEMLWDVFPNRKELGGAPANFAYMVSLLGDEGVVASRVGRDRLGNAAARRLAKLGLSQEWLQLDTKKPTGTVKVQVFEDGQPKFQIAEDVAWDNFEWTSQWQALAGRAAAVCFGSLAQRSERSRELPGGRLVVADSSAALAVLFGELAPGHCATAQTSRLTLFAVQVAGVPTLYVEEALWSSRAALEHT